MSNRLAEETSPYLLQHAGNPVDWRPWGEESLSLARSTQRPILLSIGYSSCHWCHVMERESFQDAEIAETMNRLFVNVKVDREERPDVDGIYMRAVQALTGRGGWPLTVFLTPEGEPFYGGTYYPPEPRHGMPSFPQVLEAVHRAWEDRRDEVLTAASEIRELLEESTLRPTGGRADEDSEGAEVNEGWLAQAAGSLLQRLEPVHGGFGRAPKFPQPVVVQFLLDHHGFTGEQAALDAAVLTLRKMGRGGLRDHLGGGFHRYSVDDRWLVPHFEKMLYDNALLAGTYLRAFLVTGDPEFEHVCREVLGNLLDDFQAPDGGFYTARDADSEGEEGLFYLWSAQEVDKLLGEEDGRLFRRCYDVSPGGNFEGRNILHLPHDLDRIADEENLTPTQLDCRLERSRRTLERARKEREPPLRDEKVLAGWNALAIRSLAEAGASLDEPRYLQAAVRAADRILTVLRPGERLLHQLTNGEARIPGFLEDVAGLGNALLTLHETTLESRWLELAIELDEEVERRFRDPELNLLFDAPADGESLVVRPREPMDNPVPSGTSLAAELRLRLGRLLGDTERVEAARRLVRREGHGAERAPSGFGRLLSVAARLAHAPVEVAVVGPRDDPGTRALLREAHRRFLPGGVITGQEGAETCPVPTPLLAGRGMVGGRPAAYVCRRFACRAPVTTPEALGEELDRLASHPS